MAVARGAGALRARVAEHFRQWQARRSPPARRVQLDHRRVYILPSRAGFAFACTLLLMLLAAINYQNSMAYALVFLLSALFVLVIFHTYRNLSGLAVSLSTPAAVFVGEQARFGVRLESAGKRHHAIAAGWAEGAAQGVAYVEAGHVESLELALPTTRRGWVPAPLIRVRSSFPLGLLVAWSLLDGDQRVLVYPQPLEGEWPLLPTLATGGQDALHASGNGSDDFQGLKMYQPGDSWRRLHWKAYSRGGALLVKAFGEQQGEDLALDFAALSGDTEFRLSRLCHAVLDLAGQGRVYALHLPGLNIGMGEGEAHRDQCLRALALFGGAR